MGSREYRDIVIGDKRYRLAFKYRVAASGELIVFIHGLGCSADSFSAAWEREGLDRFSLLACDLPGFGFSEKPSAFSYTMEEQARVYETLLAGFPYRRVHLVAHSMGGAVGLIMTQKLNPASFVSVEGNLMSQDCGLVSRNTIRMSESVFVEKGFNELKQSLARFPEKCFDLDHASPMAFYRSAGSLVRWTDSGNLLKLFLGLKIPKIYIYGEKSSVSHNLDQIGRVITTKFIDRSGHFPMNENPDAFYAAVEKFYGQ